MTDNRSPETTVRPLSVGNIVSAGVRLYRERLGVYLSLSLAAYLWLLVPVYGWAKYSMISGLISRLAFCELAGQPETVEQGRAKVRSRLWSFLLVAILVLVRILGVYIGGAIVFFLGTLALGAIFTAISPEFGVIAIIPGILFFIAWIVALIWLFSRWFLAELPLAIESGITSAQSVDRSWQLTKSAVGRIQFVAVISFLVTLPAIAILGYLPGIAYALLAPDFAVSPLGQLVNIILGFPGGILVLPFWQAIKAVTYYDLRSRKEGLDLELRESYDEA